MSSITNNTKGETDPKLVGTKESLFTSRIVWALKLKGIVYEFIQEDLFNKSPLLLQSNPIYKKVPALIHGGKPVPESLAILQYIDETWTENPILPEDPKERAHARFSAKFVDEKFYEASIKAFFLTGEERAQGVESIAEALQYLEGEITGEKIGFLDIVIGWIAYWFDVIEEVGFKVMDKMKYPAFDSWTKNFLEVPINKENLPSHEELPHVFQGFQQIGLAAVGGRE